MSNDELLEVAESADVIVGGYAFTLSGLGVRVLNLNNPASAALLSSEGEMLETSMDDIELAIVRRTFERNHQFLEVKGA